MQFRFIGAFFATFFVVFVYMTANKKDEAVESLKTWGLPDWAAETPLSLPEFIFGHAWLIIALCIVAAVLMIFLPYIILFLQSFKLLDSDEDRIPIYEFALIAEQKFGWKITVTDNLDLLDLGNGLRQSAIDEEIELYGRYVQYRESKDNWDRHPLVGVPVNFLKKYGLTISEHRDLMMVADHSTSEPFERYIDLHIMKNEGIHWLEKHSDKLKGRTNARERNKI